MVKLNKKMFALVVFLLLLVVTFIVTLGGFLNLQGRKIYVDISGKRDFISIQDAINYSNDGDTIFVSDGSYYEHLFINKSISLKGSKNTKIYPVNTSLNENSIIYIAADNCLIEGFKMNNKDSLSNLICIYVYSSKNKINNNIISKYEFGIYLKDEVNNGNVYTGNNFSNNKISNCNYGIYIRANANNNVIFNNELVDNTDGMNLYYSVNNSIIGNLAHSNTLYGIFLNLYSDGNKVIRNVCTENRYGIRFKSVSYNEIFLNRLENNVYGLYSCCGACDNIIYKNTFIDNKWNASDSFVNSWDNGVEGNYWEEYTKLYPNATKVGNHWSVPYDIQGGDNNDNYPLVNPPV